LTQELAAKLDYVYLNYLLLISDFRRMGNSVPLLRNQKLMSLNFSKETNIILFLGFLPVNQE
jgi:hypothetical protein